MTDDQDVTSNSLDSQYMPRLDKLFRNEGMEFTNYYVSTGLCCPSRATILRGQYCHNTKVWDNGEMNNSTYQSGGWDKFLDTGIEEETFVTLLQSAGYETAMIGKYMNQYSGNAAANHKPPGFDHWMALMTYGFYGCTFSDNGQGKYQLNKTIYQTDYIRDWAIDFLKHKRDPTKPFFLMITPFAPHAPATSAIRHRDMFQDVQFPRYDSFNPSDNIQQQRAGWIKGMPLLTQEQIDDMDRFYRNRLRSLQAVDEALEILLETLIDLDLDDNTYTFYTSDNGQHFGDFRMPAGKRQAYDTDVLVPFLVRGPGIQPGMTSTEVIQSVDLGPTFLDIATAKTRQSLSSSKEEQRLLRSTYPMDGKSILPLLNGEIPSASINRFRWIALIEMFSGSSGVGQRYENHSNYDKNHMYPNTYQAVRIINGPFDDWSINSNWLYVEWCTGEIEFYNVTNDPHQTKNLAASSIVAGSNGDDEDDVDLIPLFRRLSHLLSKLGNCSGPAQQVLGREMRRGADAGGAEIHRASLCEFHQVTQAAHLAVRLDDEDVRRRGDDGDGGEVARAVSGTARQRRVHREGAGLHQHGRARRAAPARPAGRRCCRPRRAGSPPPPAAARPGRAPGPAGAR